MIQLTRRAVRDTVELKKSFIYVVALRSLSSLLAIYYLKICLYMIVFCRRSLIVPLFCICQKATISCIDVSRKERGNAFKNIAIPPFAAAGSLTSFPSVRQTFSEASAMICCILSLYVKWPKLKAGHSLPSG